MKRRTVLTLGTFLVGGGLLSAGTGIATFRLHSNPRRNPSLTDSHLADIRARAKALPNNREKILFVGNSNTLLNDIPLLVASLAAKNGRRPWVATAAANGARLIETLRLGEFRKTVADVKWDALVLQDFSRTPLRAWDRIGSAFAIRQIASLAPLARVVLFPSWPDASGHPLYNKKVSLFEANLQGPNDFADRTERFYRSIAEANQFLVAPVVPRWMAATKEGAQLYGTDLHHSNGTGASLVAQALLDALEVDM